VAVEIILANGLIPNSLAFSSAINTMAAAPSLIPEAFPAVTVPSFRKAVCNFANDSLVTSSLGRSSVSKI